MNFKYNLEDYKKIPGLCRDWEEDPFLVPVFFEKECLIHFFYNNNYECRLCSETYGSISDKDNNFYTPFGINKNRKIVFWLGDLKELPNREQKMLIPFNINSDHDIISEFYDAQIKAVFTEPVKEVDLLLQRNKINNKFIFLFFKDVENIDTLFEKCSGYKKVIFNNEGDFKHIISILNEDLIESISLDNIRKKINNLGEKEKELGSIKLFEKYILDNYDAEKNLFNSYYVLFNLRIWADHREAESKLYDSIKRIGLTINNSYEEIYVKLIDELLKTNEKILNI